MSDEFIEYRANSEGVITVSLARRLLKETESLSVELVSDETEDEVMHLRVSGFEPDEKVDVYEGDPEVNVES